MNTEELKELRQWMTGKSNDLLESTQAALVQIMSTASCKITPPLVGALLELGVMTQEGFSRICVHKLLDAWQEASEGMS